MVALFYSSLELDGEGRGEPGDDGPEVGDEMVLLNALLVIHPAMQMHMAMKDALLAEALLIWDSLLIMRVRSDLVQFYGVSFSM